MPWFITLHTELGRKLEVNADAICYLVDRSGVGGGTRIYFALDSNPLMVRESQAEIRALMGAAADKRAVTQQDEQARRDRQSFVGVMLATFGVLLLCGLLDLAGC